MAIIYIDAYVRQNRIVRCHHCDTLFDDLMSAIVSGMHGSVLHHIIVAARRDVVTVLTSNSAFFIFAVLVA